MIKQPVTARDSGPAQFTRGRQAGYDPSAQFRPSARKRPPSRLGGSYRTSPRAGNPGSCSKCPLAGVSSGAAWQEPVLPAWEPEASVLSRAGGPCWNLSRLAPTVIPSMRQAAFKLVC
jgi:hypothetical protein